jgi:polyhydroxybutyrate depolymerase
LIALLAGCGGVLEAPVAPPGNTDPPAADPSPDPGSTPAPGVVSCTGLPAQSGDATYTLYMNTVARTWFVHAPPSYDPTKPTPVVLNLHGLGETAQEQVLLTGMNDEADANGFLVVYPSGINMSWNAGRCCGDAQSQGLDDLGFLKALLERLPLAYCVDPRRVYATGMSNGGMMTYRLACDLSDRIAAAAPVAGALVLPSCTRARAVPLFHFHGTADPLVPYNGGYAAVPVALFPAVPDEVAGWAADNGCSPAPTEFFRKDDTHCIRYDHCRDEAEVALCTVDGGGHTWPGGLPIVFTGATTNAISATKMMWDFFALHPMPATE